MAVIKCANCENEILDTEIVCPYCDFPVSDQKEEFEVEPEAESESESLLNGETRRISVASLTEAEILAQAEETKPEAEQEAEPMPEEETEPETEMPKEPEEFLPEENLQEEPQEHALETKEEPDSATMKISKEDIHSDALRRSLEERKAKRELEETAKKKKDHKIIILAATIIGIFLIIYLVINVFQSIVGEGLFEEDKESKKAKVEVSSSAEMKELGFEVHSHTLTITDESIIMTDYQAGDEKPWKDYKKDITNLTIADGIETIGAHAFDDLTGLRHVTLAPSVTTIGDSAFYACSKLEKVAFDSENSKLKSVGNYAFTDCDSLTSVTFGSELKEIGEGVFKSCDNLEKVTIPDTTTEIGADSFLSCHKVVIVCSKDSYAYDYATRNGIKVELSGEEESDKKDEKEDGKTSSPADTKPDKKPNQPSSKPTSSVPPQTEPTPNEPSVTTPQEPVDTPPEPSKEEQIAALMSKLSSAQTQEEIDNILAQIDALTN